MMRWVGIILRTYSFHSFLYFHFFLCIIGGLSRPLTASQPNLRVLFFSHFVMDTTIFLFDRYIVSTYDFRLKILKLFGLLEKIYTAQKIVYFLWNL